MARKRRILRSEMMYHVMGRGNERKSIFRDDLDREMFMSVLSEGLERYEGICHAWCLMGNHYHLMIETLLPNLSELMRWVGTTYTVRYNRRTGRVGHLFQGRYRAEVVGEESYTKRLILYIHMNPIRKKKGIKKDEKCYVGGWQELEEYEWSSHHGYAGKKVKLRPRFELSRRKYWRGGRDYQKEVEWELLNRENLDFRKEARMGLVIGGEEFQRSVEEGLTLEEEERKSLRGRLGLFRRRREIEGMWKKEKEKKWQIWIRAVYGKETKAGLAREYGYASGSGIEKVLYLLKKGRDESKSGIKNRMKNYETELKKCEVVD